MCAPRPARACPTTCGPGTQTAAGWRVRGATDRRGVGPTRGPASGGVARRPWSASNAYLPRFTPQSYPGEQLRASCARISRSRALRLSVPCSLLSSLSKFYPKL